MPKIKAILFDMDGVLVDARDWHYEALNRALALFGMEISRYDHLATFDGLPTHKKLEMLSLDRGLPRPLHQFINELKQKYTLEMVHAKCNPIFNIEFSLSRLKADGYKMAVCSNSIQQSIEVMLKKSCINHFFDFFLSNEDVGSPKPNPEMYLYAASKLQLDPKECLVIEDNENGFKAAIASGAHLLKVKSVQDVDYHVIMNCIQEIETGKSQCYM